MISLKTPESNLGQEKSNVILPSVWIVYLSLMGVSLLIGILISVLEFLFDVPLEALNFLPTLGAALSIGYHYGLKRGDYFPSGFRWRVVMMWIMTGVLVMVIFIFLFVPDILSQLYENLTLTGFFLVTFLIAIVVTVGSGISYFLLMTGEKIGVNQWKKIQQIGNKPDQNLKDQDNTEGKD